MNRRIRNVVMFVAAVLGTALLVIGVMSVADGDESGWRAIIGAVFAYTLAAIVGLRSRKEFRSRGA